MKNRICAGLLAVVLALLIGTAVSAGAQDGQEAVLNIPVPDVIAIIGTWQAEDGSSVTFTREGKASDNPPTAIFGAMDVNYSIRNGKLYLSIPLIGEQEQCDIKIEDNKITMTMEGVDFVYTRIQ